MRSSSADNDGSAAIGKGTFAGVVFHSENQPEAGVVIHNGRRVPAARLFQFIPMSRVPLLFGLALLPAISVASPGQGAADSAAIRATALDYIEGWYEGNAERMERALHPELAKRIVNTDARGRSVCRIRVRIW